MKNFRASSGIVFVCAMFLAAPMAMADDAVHKLGRGAVNVVTSWIEIPKQLHLGAQSDNPITGVVSGLGKGVSLTVLRIGVGLYEAVTFPISYPRGYVSPYEQMSLPDYAWE